MEPEAVNFYQMHSVAGSHDPWGEREIGTRLAIQWD